MLLVVMSDVTKLGVNLGTFLAPALFFLLLGVTIRPAFSQILPIEADDRLPTPSIVTHDSFSDPNYFEIGGGSTVGTNLFHSFSRFSTPAESFVYFTNESSIRNIITRVTGGDVSNLNGGIGTASSVNFYFINQNGIIVGKDASFDVGKSLLLSTAESIVFADGANFSAVSPQSDILSITSPIGLQLGQSAAPISIVGSTHNLYQDSNTNKINTSFHPLTFRLNSGDKTLAIVGGDISMVGGNLTIFGGNIELGAAKSGYAGLDPNSVGWHLNYSGVTEFGNISLSGAASIDLSGPQGGSFRVQARNLSLSDGSLFLSQNEGDLEGRESFVRATESISLSGFSQSPFDQAEIGLPSSFIAETSFDSTGKAGNLTIETPVLKLSSGAQISNGTYGPGTGGELTIRAQAITVTGSNDRAPSAIINNGGALSTGNAGSINIQSDTLFLNDNGLVSTQNFGKGNGGLLNVRANNIRLEGSDVIRQTGTGIFAGADRGNGGRIQLDTNTLTLLAGSQVTSFTSSAGQGGDININARSIEVSGVSSTGFSSGIYSTVSQANATGNAGNMIIKTDNLLVSNGGQIGTSTLGIGNAGNLTINADRLRIEGTSETQPSGLFASVSSTATGRGGLISIATGQLEVFDGGRITADSAGAGAAGSLSIKAQTIDLAGSSTTGASALLGTVTGSGDGRDLTVVADRLTVRDGATIAVGNTLSQGGTQGSGTVGNLNLDIGNLTLSGGSLSAQSLTGDRGSINIRAKTLNLRDGAQINANALGDATGGNIDIQTQLLFAVLTENSDITANAITNRGGAVRIQTDQLLGLQANNQLTPLSDITATSEQGAQFSGVVEIKASETDLSRSLTKLPTLMTAIEPIRVSCSASAGTLSATGKGGLPVMAEQPIRSGMLWGSSGVAAAIAPAAPKPSLLVQANAWTKDAQGRIQLLAQSAAQLSEAGCLTTSP